MIASSVDCLTASRLKDMGPLCNRNIVIIVQFLGWWLNCSRLASWLWHESTWLPHGLWSWLEEWWIRKYPDIREIRYFSTSLIPFWCTTLTAVFNLHMFDIYIYTYIYIYSIILYGITMYYKGNIILKICGHTFESVAMRGLLRFSLAQGPEWPLWRSSWPPFGEGCSVWQTVVAVIAFAVKCWLNTARNLCLAGHQH